MPVNYGVLRGKVINSIPYKSGADHFQIEVQADQLYRIAVDVYSQFAGEKKNYAHDGNTMLDTDRMVMFYKDENFTHPLTDKILQVSTGFTAKKAMDQAICLDYLRTSPALFPIGSMKIVTPKSALGPGDDLNDDIGPWVQKATNNPDAEVFAFGSGWDDNAAGGHPDTQHYFNPNPSLGIHDIHMNQGDSGQEEKYNGIHQDGALFFHFRNANQWVALFFRFQVQEIKTDNNGNPIE
ncbi:DUF2278 family protein [Pedobacter sp. L105]|uniref:DUF2278 family protein n=1 Tax=Pedobacter sp. L105 TaxID=1641871 RepID=UPI00131BF700|nr:DUF2278 family protein [Pedobacter sp. L105]